MRKEFNLIQFEDFIKMFNKCFDCSFSDYVYFMNNVNHSNCDLKTKQNVFIQYLETSRREVK